MVDTYPIRLPSGGKALLIVPDTFTHADAEHVKRWVDLIALHSDGWQEPLSRGGAEMGEGPDRP